jgi:hypothetical protein
MTTKKPSEKLRRRLVPTLPEFTIIAFAVAVWIHEEKWKDAQPHEIKNYVAGKLISDVWTTNRYEVISVAAPVVTADGLVNRQYSVTNRLW